MSGRASLDCVTSICRLIHHVRGTWGGFVPSLETKWWGDDHKRKESVNEMAEPVVAFSRPPRPPRLVGTLVLALSLWESWSRKDKDD